MNQNLDQILDAEYGQYVDAADIEGLGLIKLGMSLFHPSNQLGIVVSLFEHKSGEYIVGLDHGDEEPTLYVASLARFVVAGDEGQERLINSIANEGDIFSSAILYKYLAPERVDVLSSLKIRYTQAAALNDPLEGMPADGGEDELRLTNHLSKHLADAGIGFLSLSAISTNNLMWSHYASNHTGFAIGFDASHPYFKERLWKVEYSDERPLNSKKSIFYNYRSYYTKHGSWSYEKEYRVIQHFSRRVRLSNGKIVGPCRKDYPLFVSPNEVVLYKYPLESIVKIILGWKMKEHIADQIKAAIDKHKLNRNIVYRCEPKSNSYELTLKRET